LKRSTKPNVDVRESIFSPAVPAVRDFQYSIYTYRC
jgi:hypothetical protein